MQTLTHSVTIDHAARRLLIDETLIEKIMAGVVEASTQTNFVPHLRGAQHTPFPLSTMLSRAEWKNLFKLAREIDSRADEVLSAVFKAARTWAAGYISQSGLWLLKSSDDLNVVRYVFDALGIERARWRVRFDEREAEEGWYEAAITNARALEFQLIKPRMRLDRLPLFPGDSRAADRHQRFAVSIEESNLGWLRSMKVTHHFLLSAVVFSLVTSANSS